MTTERARNPARVTILYEDRRGPAQGFGLHELVLSAAHDIILERGTAMPRYVLSKRIIAIPKKSDTKVLAAIWNDADRIHGGHHAIVAWLDDDQIHRPLRLSANDSTRNKIAAIRAVAPRAIEQRPGALAIFLVRGNVETFLGRIDAAQPNSFSRSAFEAAMDKDLSARDQCFAEVARPFHREWRAAIRRHDAGFDCAIRYLACLATYEPWPPW